MSLKILHIPYGYFPSASGGTEVYVKGLCEALITEDVESVIAAPGEQEECYDHHGITVHRFVGSPEMSLETMYGEGNTVAADQFDALLESIKPDLVHFHSFTPAVSVQCLRKAKTRALPCVFTYHTATASCLRGTLMRWGDTPCDGVLRNHTCSSCFLQGHGVPKIPAHTLSWASLFTGGMAQSLPNRWRIPLSASQLTERWHHAVKDWLEGMDRVIALCEWTTKLLALNNVSETKIRMVRHGINYESLVVHDVLPSPPLRLAFLGRLDPTKGVPLLIEALALMPDAAIQLDLYTLVQGELHPKMQALMDQAKQEQRIRFCNPLPPEKVVQTLRQYHALLVPSVTFETGPLVVLEAFAAGSPVIGSNFGGIAEWVVHEQNGLLVSPSSPAAWRDTLSRLIHEPKLLPTLREGIRPPRTMQNVASEMNDIYRELLIPSAPCP